MDEDEHEGFDYDFDLEAGVVIHRNGFCTRIIDMHDEDNESTFDLDEVAIVYFRMPPEGRIVGFDLKSYLEDLEDLDNFEFEH